MTRAIRELKSALVHICNQVPDQWSLPVGDRLAQGDVCEDARDRVLLAVDAFLFDLIIMKANIHDFHLADPRDWFRMSECKSVLDGIRALSVAARQYLVDVLRK